MWSTLGSFAASLILLSVAAVLILTGRHKLRLEVDAGVTLGVVASRDSPAQLSGSTLRRSPPGLLHKVAIWLTFTTICAFNGMLLVLVSENTTL